MRYIYLLFILSFFAAGCASTKPNNIVRSSKKSSFTTGTRATNFSFDNSGLSGSTKILYQVSAHCSGPKCVPKEARLSFNIETGSNDTYLNDRNLTIHAGQKEYHWDSGKNGRNIYDASPVASRITSVTMGKKKLQKIASEKNVSGVLAGRSFKWSYENRKPLRNLINEMQSPEAAEVTED